MNKINEAKAALESANNDVIKAIKAAAEARAVVGDLQADKDFEDWSRERAKR